MKIFDLSRGSVLISPYITTPDRSVRQKKLPNDIPHTLSRDLYVLTRDATFTSSHVIAHSYEWGELSEEAGGRAVAVSAMASEQSVKICDTFVAASSTNVHHVR